MSTAKIGKKIMDFRRLKGITIRDFSEMTGLSTSLISQLERGMGNPSLNALEAIADALGIPMFSLFMGEIDNASLILRREERKKVFDSDSKHILYDILTPSPIKSSLDLLLMNLTPKAETAGGFSTHAGEEIAFILEGEVFIMLEDEKFLLREGDTARILPTTRHKFINETDKEIKVLFVRSSPI
jgi:transcriptional regulator with XRE-family HTH domain